MYIRTYIYTYVHTYVITYTTFAGGNCLSKHSYVTVPEGVFAVVMKRKCNNNSESVWSGVQYMYFTSTSCAVQYK